jgi:hypothetical protein
MARREKYRVLDFCIVSGATFRGLTWLMPKLVLMGGRVSGYASIGNVAARRRKQFRRGAPDLRELQYPNLIGYVA